MLPDKQEQSVLAGEPGAQHGGLGGTENGAGRRALRNLNVACEDWTSTSWATRNQGGFIYIYNILLYFIYHINYYMYFYIFVFLGLQPQHMEVPRLGVKSELQLLACATAIAIPDPSRVCDLRHSSLATPDP